MQRVSTLARKIDTNRRTHRVFLTSSRWSGCQTDRWRRGAPRVAGSRRDAARCVGTMRIRASGRRRARGCHRGRAPSQPPPPRARGRNVARTNRPARRCTPRSSGRCARSTTKSPRGVRSPRGRVPCFLPKLVSFFYKQFPKLPFVRTLPRRRGYFVRSYFFPQVG